MTALLALAAQTAAAAEDIRDIRDALPPVEAAGGVEWLVPAALALIAAAVVLAWWRRRRADAWAEVTRRLDELPGELAPAEVADAVVLTLRSWLDGALGLTPDLVVSARRAGEAGHRLEPAAVPLRAVLQICERLRFAGEAASDEDLELLLAAAREVVDRCRQVSAEAPDTVTPPDGSVGQAADASLPAREEVPR